MQPLKYEGYSLILTESIEEITADWRALAHNNIYADPNYLNMLETFGPGSYKYCYALLQLNGKPVAAIYFQFKRIELLKDFRLHTHSKNIFVRFGVWLERQFLKMVNQNLLICGNVLLTGEYSFGTDRTFDLDPAILNEVIEKVKDFIRIKWNRRVHGILSKDFFIDSPLKEHDFKVPGFTGFRVQPGMVIDLNNKWQTFDDYLAAVKSKYRVKFKKVLKKSSALEFRSLELDELEHWNDSMYKLYRNTADKASFSLFRLHPKYFYELKKCFGDSLKICGMFLGGEMLGFYTFVNNNGNGDAHFIGYDLELNAKYQIYFNILLGLLQEGINQKVNYLNLSRTALEIKSSVGAEPHEMLIYLRHENKLLNSFLPGILKLIVPKNDWLARNPFK